MSDDPEVALHFSPDGPVPVVLRWLDVIRHGDLTTYWPEVDADLRLALVQSWVLAERPDVSDRDAIAATLADPMPTHPLWSDFAGWRVSRWQAIFAELPEWGVWGHPVLVAPDVEVVVLAPTPGGTARRVEAGEAIEAMRLVVRHDGDAWRLAGIGGSLPKPGWPPSEFKV